VAPDDGATDPSGRRDRRTAWALVAAQFALLAAVLVLPAGHLWRLPAALTVLCAALGVVGVVVMVAGGTALGRGLTAAPLPNGHAQLRTTGLYRYVRHPIYSGLLLLAVARTATSGSAWVVAACVALIALLRAKARWEERHLRHRFPGYAEYADRTPRFVPRVGRQ